MENILLEFERENITKVEAIEQLLALGTDIALDAIDEVLRTKGK